MGEEHWQAARLIPTSGISGSDEAERRATSALLAVMGAVREFGAAIVRPLGAPAGALATYIEVPFKLGDRDVRPDGVIQVSRAGRTWTALVEVKTGDMALGRDQVEAYLDVARETGADVVLTISNHLSPAPGVHPVDVDKRRLKRVELHHLSWAEVLTIAVQQRVHRGVGDPDQAWILTELIRYLEHPKSGALDFTDMGGSWVSVREAVLAGTLRGSDKGLGDVVSRWEQLLRFAALRLGRELGSDVQVVLSRKEMADPTLRFADVSAQLVERGQLRGTIRIPDAVGPVQVLADLRAGTVTMSVDLDAPREGRPTTRVNWLTRQLKDAPGGLRLEAWSLGARSSMSELLDKVREDPNLLLDDPRRELRSFRISAVSPLGTKRGTGRGALIDSVLSALDGFYEAVVQNIHAWNPKAPQLPRGGQLATEAAGIDITPPPDDLTEASADDLGIDEPIDQQEIDQGPDADPTAVQSSAEGDGHPDENTGAALPAPAMSWAAPDAAQLVDWSAAQDRLDRERDHDAASDEGALQQPAADRAPVPLAPPVGAPVGHSHSMVPGGLDVMS